MLLVRTYLGKSKIQGIGLFATEHLPEKTIIRRFTGLDLRFDYDEMLEFSEAKRNLILRYGMYDKDHALYLMDVDNGRFINHSDNPNLISLNEQTRFDLMTSRDISASEELTADYRTFDWMSHNTNLRMNTSHRNFLDKT